MEDDLVVENSRPGSWRIWTEDGGLSWADPGPDRGALREAIEDCAETLSPSDEPPALSTYWLDQLLHGLDLGHDGEVAHGNLWTITIRGRTVEIRMDVDPPSSEPIEAVEIDELIAGLKALRDEVTDQLSAGHQLDARPWLQKNPVRPTPRET